MLCAEDQKDKEKKLYVDYPHEMNSLVRETTYVNK